MDFGALETEVLITLAQVQDLWSTLDSYFSNAVSDSSKHLISLHAGMKLVVYLCVSNSSGLH